MKMKPWIALPIAGLAATVIGVASVAAAPSPAATGATNYAQVFTDRLAGILHLTRVQTQDALKQAQLQTVDQMLKDGKITQGQADTMKAAINAGNGLDALTRVGHRPGPFGAGRALRRDVRTAELKAAAGVLHMTESDLTAQLKSGKTLADLARASNVTDAAVRASMKAAAEAVLDNAVKAGTITQDQENAILSRAGRGFGHHPALPRPAQTPAAYIPSA